MSAQWWLAELDQYGNPKLIDGAHSRRSAVNKAAHLIQALHLGTSNRRFAVARVELSECVPSSKGVNQSAVRTLNSASYAQSRIAAQESALERILWNFELLLAGKPVKEAAEAIGEARAALAEPPSREKETKAGCPKIDMVG